MHITHGTLKRRATRRLLGLALSGILAGAPAPLLAARAADDAAPSTRVAPRAASVPSIEDWQRRTQVDLDAFADALRQNYIYAAYPDPDRWRAAFDRTLAAVKAEVPLVHDEAGYRAVLTDLASAFHDAHVYMRFDPSTPVPYDWPGFLARYDNGTYRVAASRQTAIADGAEVSACDGKPMAWWVATVAQHEIGLPDRLETTRNAAALRLFVDRGSPLRPRPARCVIGGRTVALDWTPAPAQHLDPIIASLRGRRAPEAGTRPIGPDGAWVTLRYFVPDDAAQAKAFHAAIDAAPSLRDKRFIVLDVRGNGGGPYNWFMAYLRGLYGQAYADHYATERLHIRAVYRLSPAYLALEKSDDATPPALKEPADPPYEINAAADDRLEAQDIAAGKPVFRSNRIPIPRDGKPPANPVRAKVYVLTDYGCASACIGFVDELKRFPGVRQIGLPTAVDSRSGTAVAIRLPSGRATAMIAAMTRDGRIRDDNEPQVPSIRFTGDMRDDRAVENWVLNDVVPSR